MIRARHLGAITELGCRYPCISEGQARQIALLQNHTMAYKEAKQELHDSLIRSISRTYGIGQRDFSVRPETC